MRRAVVALALAGALAAGPPSQAQQWDPGERTLITRLERIGALTTDARHVYAATSSGLFVYDHVARGWLNPSTVVNGFPVGVMPTALAWDDFSGELWMGTQAGAVWRYSPTFVRWEQGTIAPGTIHHIAFAGGDAWIEAGGRWLVARAGMFTPEPVPPGSVPAEARARVTEQATTEAPFLRTTLAALPADPGGNRWRATALAAGARRGSYWIGTDGGGLIAYDAHTNTAEWLQPGLRSRAATLVARAAGLLWFAGDADAYPPGLVAADTTLAHWYRLDARLHGGPEDVVYDALEAHDRIWFAGAGGVHALRSDALARGPRTTDWLAATSLGGLPADDAFALARSIDGVWIGTARGLVHVDTAGTVSSLTLAGIPVYGVAVDGDALWVASARGLLRIAGGAPEQPADAPPSLRGEVRSVLVDDGVLHVLTADALHSRGQDGAWRVAREPALAGIGALRRLAAAAEGIWIAAERGIALQEAATGMWRYYSAPADIPEGPVVSIQPVGQDVWLGTPAGALRLPVHR